LTKEQVKDSLSVDTDRPVDRQREIAFAPVLRLSLLLGRPVPLGRSRLPGPADGGGAAEHALVDAETWAIRYCIVDTRNWLPGRKVLVSPEWIQRVSWEESKVHVDLSKRHIEAAPEFDSSVPLAREHEERLYTHLGRAKYWEREPRTPEGKANGKT